MKASFEMNKRSRMTSAQPGVKFLLSPPVRVMFLGLPHCLGCCSLQSLCFIIIFFNNPCTILCTVSGT